MTSLARWELSAPPDGCASLVFTGELDTASTPAAWIKLQCELNPLKLSSLDIAAGRLDDCDSAGLALLYFLSVGGMTPGANVTVHGLNPERQHLLRSFSTEDFRALEEHEPTSSLFVEDVGKATSSWIGEPGADLD